MAVFLVVPTEQGSKHSLAAALAVVDEEGNHKFDHFALPTDVFVVSFKGTSQELATAIGINDGQAGSAIVSRMTSYWGWAPANIWEWIASRWED